MSIIIAGTETQVNTTVTGFQFNQSVDALAGGGWVVTWQSANQDGGGYGIYQQAYGADGIPQGVETQVNSYTTGVQSNPRVVALEGGGWVVAWGSDGQDGSGAGVYQQAYAANGTPQGVETQVNTFVTSAQESPQITALEGGGWVVTWVSDGQDGSSAGVYQQAYGANGAPLGEETQVNTFTTNAQHSIQVAALDGGGWVVTWNTPDENGGGNGIHQQAYGANGVARGTETEVNTYMSSEQTYQQIVALESGGWVVTWSSFNQDGSNYGIYQRVFDADGVAVGGGIQVNTFTTNAQLSSQITALEGGGWVVAWESFGQDGANNGVFQQAYGANGMPVGEEVRVNTYVIDSQILGTITALEGGGWVVTWTSDSQDGNGDGLYQQVYAADGTREGGETRVNDFTQSYQGTPQVVALAHGGWIVTWMSNDQDGDSYGVYQKEFHIDSEPVLAEAIGDQTAAEDQAFHFTIPADAFTDANGDTLTYVATLSSGGPLPAWLEFDPATRTFSGTPAEADAGEIDIEITVSDGSNPDVTDTFTLTVGTVNDAPILADAIGDRTATEDEAFSFTIPADAFVDEEGDTLIYAATLSGGDPLPAWLEFDPATRTFSGTPAEADAGEIDIEVTVSDGSNPGVTDTFTLTIGTVNDTPQGADTTITIKEDTSHTFTVADFGFTDAEGDAFSAVVISMLPSSGTLKLDGANVSAGQEIAIDDLDGLVWKPARDAHGEALATLGFQVVDDGGAPDMDPSANTITFDVTSVVDRLVGDDKGGTLKGTDDDDTLRGKQGRDILLGKDGDDNLRSVGGNDRFKGGSGADTFVFSTGSDKDTISDFETGIDRIDLSKWKAIEDYADVKDHARNHGDDVWITAGDDILVIKNMHRSELDPGDFLF